MEPLKLEQAKRSDRYSHKKRDNSQNRGAGLKKRPPSKTQEQSPQPKEFLGMPCKKVTFRVPPKEEREAMRTEFEMGKRAEFIKYLAATQQEALKRAGITPKQLEGMKRGYTPHGFNTHHKLPIHGGGTNDFSNLVLVPREPWHDMMHYHMINPQTKGLQEGNERQIVIPYPDTPVFEPSPQYKFLEKWTKKGRKTYGKNKNTSLKEVEAEAKRRIFLAQVNRNSGR